MSSIRFLTSIFALAVSFWSEGGACQDRSPLDRLMGYGEMTTGAGECDSTKTCVCHVREATPEAFQACVSGEQPTLVVFDHPTEIKVADRAIRVGSNKTIQGPALLTGDRAIIFIHNSSNVIIRNLTLRSTLRSVSSGSNCANPMKGRDTLGCGVMIAVEGNSKDLWIDHNDFYHCGGKCITIYGFPQNGKNLDGRILAPDRITLSNNVFRSSFYGVLIGLGKATAEQVPKHERVTFYGNLFNDVHQRSPAVASFAWAHVFNNLIMNWGGCYNCPTRLDPNYPACRGPNFGGGSAAYGQGQLFAERNVYEARPTAGSCKGAIMVDTYNNPETGQNRGEGLIRASENKLQNGAQIEQRRAREVFDPADPSQVEAFYRYSMIPVDMVQEYVSSHAGPRRQ